MNTPPASPNPLPRSLDVLLPAVLAAVCFAFICVPIPARILDAGLILSLGLALATLMVVASVRRALEASSFPTILLFLTIFRLSLNVASTRLILTQGTDFEGIVITSAARLMMGDSLAVGLAMLVILIAIQFLVISKGAERMSEVVARFALDGMQLKMLSIQQLVEQHQITAAEGEARLDQLNHEADFYSRMDGATKYIRGEALAGILILLVNLAAGALSAVRALDGDPLAVLAAYAKLTVGDGLVTLLPSLLAGAAGALLIAKTSSSESTASQVLTEFGLQVRALGGAAGVLAFVLVVLSAGSGPWMLAFLLGAGLLAWVARKALSVAVEPAGTAARPGLEDFELRSLLVRLSTESLPALAENGTHLDGQLEDVRVQLQNELGLTLSPIAVTEDGTLPALAYALDIRGQEVGQGRLPHDWAEESQHHRTEDSIAAFVAKKVRQNAEQLVGRQELEEILSDVRKKAAAVADAVEEVDKSAILAVLKGLLAERISIRNRVAILEAVADSKQLAPRSALLIEAVRERIARQISGQLRGERDDLPIMRLRPELENELLESYDEKEDFLAIYPGRVEDLNRLLTDACESFEERGLTPVLVTHPLLRRHLRQLASTYLGELRVLSPREIPRDVRPRVLLVVGEPPDQRPQGPLHLVRTRPPVADDGPGKRRPAEPSGRPVVVPLSAVGTADRHDSARRDAGLPAEPGRSEDSKADVSPVLARRQPGQPESKPAPDQGSSSTEVPLAVVTDLAEIRQ